MTPGAPPLTSQLDGEGPVALFLNGGMMTMASWDPFAAPFLAAGRAVLRCDLRGQLRSPGEPPAGFGGHVEDVLRTMDAHGVEHADVLGASFGGEIALLLAARHPDRVRSLVAITATDRSDETLRSGSERMRAACEAVIEGRDPGALHDLLTAEIYAPAWCERNGEALEARRAVMERLPREWYVGMRKLSFAIEDFDLRPELANIRCPVLVVIAGADRVMPRSGSEAVAAAIPGAEIAIWPEAGHALVAEETEDVARHCLDFIEGLD